MNRIGELIDRLDKLIAILEGNDDGMLSLGELLEVLRSARDVVLMYEDLGA